MAEIADELARAVRAVRRSRSTTASAASAIGETSVVIAVSAPHRAGRARRVQGRDRRAEGARAALEERGLRGRRGMDRAGLMSDELPRLRPDPAGGTRLARDAHPPRCFGPLVAGAIALAKFSFVLVKFGTIFIAVGGYALIWGWKFAVGFVLLILLHETRPLHRGEARRAATRSCRSSSRSSARTCSTRAATRGRRCASRSPGRSSAALAALVCYLVGQSQRLRPALALAYFGFFLNLFNLIPFGIFDGGAVWRSARWLRARRRRARLAFASTRSTSATAVAARRSAWSRHTSRSTAL